MAGLVKDKDNVIGGVCACFSAAQQTVSAANCLMQSIIDLQKALPDDVQLDLTQCCRLSRELHESLKAPQLHIWKVLNPPEFLRSKSQQIKA